MAVTGKRAKKIKWKNAHGVLKTKFLPVENFLKAPRGVFQTITIVGGKNIESRCRRKESAFAVGN